MIHDYYIVSYVKHAQFKMRYTTWTEDMIEDMENCGGYIP